MVEDRIAGLRIDLISYGNEIVDHVNSLYSSKRSHSTVIDLKIDPKNMISSLSHEFAELVDASKEQSEYAHVHMDAVKECSDLIALLDEVTTIVASFTECEKAVNSYKVVVACKLVAGIEKTLAKLTAKTTTAVATGKIFSNLREEHQRLTNKLLSKLKRALTECFHYENGRIIVNKTLQGVLRSEDIVLEDAVSLSDVWESVVALKVTDDFASDLTSDVWQHILKPLWAERKLTLPKAKSEGENGAELLFESIIKQSKELPVQDGRNNKRAPGPCKVPVPTLLECVGVVLSFVLSEMLCSNEHMALSVHQIWTAPNTSLIEPILESVTGHLPKVESELAAFKKALERPCHDFEERFGRFHHPTTAEAPLTNFLSKMADVYADARRTDILRRAREIVLADYHNTMLAGGDALEDEPSSAGDIGNARALIDQSGFGMQKLKFDSCQVSLTSNRILKLVHEVMRQACEASSKSIANVLVQSARDCLDIFIAVVPMKFSSVIDALPRMGGVFYNDCAYIAHNSVLITHKYRQELVKADESFQGCIGFVDFIPRFRSVGELCLRNHLEDQRMALAEHIRGICITPDGETDTVTRDEAVVPTPASLLKGLTSKIAPRGSHAAAASGGRRSSNALVNDEQSTLKLVEALERLSEQWRGVLQEGVYSRVLGNLLNGIIAGLMQPVLMANCVSVEASSEISRIFKTVQSLRSIFPSEYKDEDSLQTICPLWKKFLALTDLLDYSLGDVAEWLPRKKFSSFTGQEMTSLIKALFEDTDKRLQILQSILAMTS